MKSSSGLDPLWWFFLAFGDEVRQAGSQEEPVDHRGSLCQTSAPYCPPPNCWISSGFVPPKTPSNAITLDARASSRVARCPECGKKSARVHSCYTRMLADLPWQGIPVTMYLRVRRFFCDHKACNRVIFAERLPGLAAHYGRRTERLESWFTHVSFALGGEPGSRLLKDLGVVVSGDTLLNHIRSMRLPSHETPRGS